MDRTSTKFLCKCKTQAGWIEDGQITQPCPNCGRVYKGIYSKKCLTILAKVIKNEYKNF